MLWLITYGKHLMVSLIMVVLNSRDWPGKLWLPKNVPENSVIIITTWKTRHRSLALTMPKIYSNIWKNRLEGELHDLKFFLNEIFHRPACLTIGNNLPPKPLVLWPPFFLRVKVILSAPTFLVLKMILDLHHCDHFHLQCLAWLLLKGVNFRWLLSVQHITHT